MSAVMNQLLASDPQQPIIAAVPQALLKQDVDALDASDRLLALGGYAVYCAAAQQLPHVLREIGRLRELAFRAVGEGTGQPLDLDSYDPHYHHLFVWSEASSEIVGAYRLAFTLPLITKCGVTALYTHSLFEFDASLFDRLGPSLEMGRSFVHPAWQGNTRVLRLLWAGIATLLDRHPAIRHLFGAVSVSPKFSDVGKFLIMSSLQLHHMDANLKHLVRPRNAPCLTSLASEQRLLEISAGLADPTRLSKFLQRIEHGMKLPMLIKHYIELKGRFAGFSVDNAFNGTLDGLVFVRVEDISTKMRAQLTKSSAKP
ncbi:MAG: GNAT family N-acyltransferase [Polaromonas sp.]